MSIDHQSSRRISLLPILSVNFIGTLGFSIVLPFLLFLVTKWGGNALVYGIMGATYSFFQLIGAPILGRWSDSIGRKKVLLLSQAGTLVSWLIFILAFVVPQTTLLQVDSELFGSFTLTLPLIILFIARGTDGLTGGNVSVAAAYLADITEEENRSENFGKMAVSANLGFIFGPALAGILGATAMGELLPVLAALIISAAAVILIMFRLPESQACVVENCADTEGVRKVFGQEHKECYEMQGENKYSFVDVLRIKRIPLLLSLYFLVMLAFNFFYISFPVYALQQLKWSIASMGTFFTFMSVLMVIVQGPVLKRASRKWSDSSLITFGSLILAGGFTFYISSSNILIYFGTALLAVGNGLMWSSLMSVLSKAAGERMQGAVQGYASSIGAVASIMGLVLGGLLFEIMQRWIFLLAAFAIMCVFAASFNLKSRQPAAVSK